jgi:hypothetical protein
VMTPRSCRVRDVNLANPGGTLNLAMVTQRNLDMRMCGDGDLLENLEVRRQETKLDGDRNAFQFWSGPSTTGWDDSVCLQL